MKQFKACGARNLPSIDYGRNAAWLQLARPGHLTDRMAAPLRAGRRPVQGLHQDAAVPILSAPARMVTHARRRILKIPPGWEWSADLATAADRLQALHPA